MTNEMITALESAGFKRWQKGNLDRLYINATQLGLVCEFYKTGNVKLASFCGNEISNSEARRMMAAKTFIDAKTGKLFGDNETLKAAAETLMNETVKGE